MNCSKDPYHPRYPSVDKDYFERLMNLAGYLLVAERIGLKPFLCCSKEHKQLVGYKEYKQVIKA